MIERAPSQREDPDPFDALPVAGLDGFFLRRFLNSEKNTAETII
jgi:hypothetical protein